MLLHGIKRGDITAVERLFQLLCEKQLTDIPVECIPILVGRYQRTGEVLTLKCLTLMFLTFRDQPDFQRENTNQYLPKVISHLIAHHSSNQSMVTSRQHLECLEALIHHFPTLCRPVAERISCLLTDSSNLVNNYSTANISRVNSILSALCLSAPKAEVGRRYADLFQKSLGSLHQRLDNLLRTVDEEPYGGRGRLRCENDASQKWSADYADRFPLVCKDAQRLLDLCCHLISHPFIAAPIAVPIDDLMRLLVRVVNANAQESVVRAGEDREEFSLALRLHETELLPQFTRLAQLLIRCCGRRLLRYRTLLVVIIRKLSLFAQQPWAHQLATSCLQWLGGSCATPFLQQQSNQHKLLTQSLKALRDGDVTSSRLQIHLEFIETIYAIIDSSQYKSGTNSAIAGIRLAIDETLARACIHLLATRKPLPNANVVANSSRNRYLLYRLLASSVSGAVGQSPLLPLASQIFSSAAASGDAEEPVAASFARTAISGLIEAQIRPRLPLSAAANSILLRKSLAVSPSTNDADVAQQNNLVDASCGTDFDLAPRQVSQLVQTLPEATRQTAVRAIQTTTDLGDYWKCFGDCAAVITHSTGADCSVGKRRLGEDCLIISKQLKIEENDVTDCFNSMEEEFTFNVDGEPDLADNESEQDR